MHSKQILKDILDNAKSGCQCDLHKYFFPFVHFVRKHLKGKQLKDFEEITNIYLNCSEDLEMEEYQESKQKTHLDIFLERKKQILDILNK